MSRQLHWYLAIHSLQAGALSSTAGWKPDNPTRHTQEPQTLLTSDPERPQKPLSFLSYWLFPTAGNEPVNVSEKCIS